MSEIGVYVT